MRPFPTVEGGFGAIYVDPPWTFQTRSAKGKGRSAEAHYDCMTLDEICELRPRLVASPDCVLLMWVTDHHLQDAFAVLRAWEFTYKTVGFYWAKTIKSAGLVWNDEDFPIGTGYWTRSNPEQCLLAVRGQPKRRHSDVRKLIVAPRREHSRKPDETYERIERLCAGPYLELFARNTRSGWWSWGDQVECGISARRWPSVGPP